QREGAAQERHRQVLRRRHHAQAQAPRAPEGGQEAHEARRAGRDPAGGLPRGAAAGRRMRRRHPGEAAEGGREAESGGLWEQLSTLGLAVLIALAIRAFVVEPYRIPSESMLPTLLVGDHLFVNKFVYGIKIPFTRVRLPGLRAPERGDVVVFTVAKQGPQTFP